MSSHPENLKFEFDQGMDQEDKTVICLGKKFKNDEERRVYFTELLREKLKDPEFRKIEGFLLRKTKIFWLCPILLTIRPVLTPGCKILLKNGREKQKPAKPEGYVYKREPYAADVSEGKR